MRDGVRFSGGAWLPDADRGPDADRRVVSIVDGMLVAGGHGVIDEHGSLLPGIHDAHVHLTLIDAAAFRGTPVASVRDLGGEPAAVRAAARAATQTATHTATRTATCAVSWAGRFHTAVGGYPSGRAWAPRGAVREVTDAADARRAIDEWAADGAAIVKVALHAGMRLLDDRTLGALVTAAHDIGAPVIAHVEGPGQTARAVTAGVDELAHTPWTERVDDEVLTAAAAAGMAWVSTLSIHQDTALATALDNLRRFLDAGGTARYGTDLGNGQLPIGVNEREIELLGEAGLHGDALLRAVVGERRHLADAWHSPHPLPTSAQTLITWFRDARHVDAAALARIVEENRGIS